LIEVAVAFKYIPGQLTEAQTKELPQLSKPQGTSSTDGEWKQAVSYLPLRRSK